MMGLQVTYGPAAAVEINDQRALGRAVIHPRCQRAFGEGKLKRARIDFGKLRILPSEPVHSPVVPAKSEDFKLVYECRQNSLLCVDIPRFRIRLILVSAIRIDAASDVTAVPQIIQVRHRLTRGHLYLAVANFSAKEALKALG